MAFVASFKAVMEKRGSPASVLAFSVPTSAPTRLEILDLPGRLVRTLVNGPLAAGRYAFSWDGRDTGGRFLGAGMYFTRLVSGRRQAVRRLVRL